MLRFLKRGTLAAAKHTGVFRMVASSPWRQRRLLILCYHGVALKDEHEWRPLLFVTPAFFRRRMEILARDGYRVLPLAAAIDMMKHGNLPPKSVAITFDDGFYDFHHEAYPVLREFRFPATVYQTTYYCDYPFPVFNLVLSYLFWRGSGKRLDGTALGVPDIFELSNTGEQDRAVKIFLDLARHRGYTPSQKDELAARLAEKLNLDYSEIARTRMLQLMSAKEVAEIAADGMDVQLHTHRHRTPLDEAQFVREIRDNRQWIASKTGKRAKHFCYPSGVYRSEFLPWLRSERVVSATTSESGLATRVCDPLLLPRLLDAANLTESEFEGWLTGVSSWLV